MLQGFCLITSCFQNCFMGAQDHTLRYSRYRMASQRRLADTWHCDGQPRVCSRLIPLCLNTIFVVHSLLEPPRKGVCLSKRRRRAQQRHCHFRQRCGPPYNICLRHNTPRHSEHGWHLEAHLQTGPVLLTLNVTVTAYADSVIALRVSSGSLWPLCLNYRQR